jgi:prevent-host-death family protein
MPSQLDTTPNTETLTAFRDNPAELLRQLESTGRPITLTVDGKPKAILQDPAEYQRLLDLAALADEEEDLRQGLEDIAEGRTRPAREVFAELREEYGIRG